MLSLYIIYLYSCRYWHINIKGDIGYKSEQYHYRTFHPILSEHFNGFTEN